MPARSVGSSAITFNAAAVVNTERPTTCGAATYANTIGDPVLFAYWTDPDFDPSQRAFYYVRVIEIPTPRWTAYEAMRFNIEMSKDVPMEHQERAYTSSIWYTP